MRRRCSDFSWRHFVDSVLIAVLLTVIIGCGRRHAYTVDQIHEQTRLTNAPNGSIQGIQNAKLFAERFLCSYRETVRAEIPAAFHPKLIFATGDVSETVIFSANSESLLHFYSASKNELFVEYASVPVQLYLFANAGLDGSGLDNRLQVDLPAYSSWPGMFEIQPENGYNYFHGGRIIVVNGNPKNFGLSTNSLVILQGMTGAYRFADGSEREFRGIPEGELGILTSDEEFSVVTQRAAELGRGYASIQIGALYTGSEFFRNALADKRLKPHAQAIKEKVSRSSKDPSFDYPLWQLKMDLTDLKNEGIELGATEGYADELYESLDLKQKPDGFLLCYYSTHLGFMVQWSLLNVGLFILCFPWFFVRVAKNSILKTMQKKIAFPALVLTVNAWAFHSRPLNLPFGYWIIPGLLCFVCVVINFQSKKTVSNWIQACKSRLVWCRGKGSDTVARTKYDIPK